MTHDLKAAQEALQQYCYSHPTSEAVGVLGEIVDLIDILSRVGQVEIKFESIQRFIVEGLSPHRSKAAVWSTVMGRTA